MIPLSNADRDFIRSQLIEVIRSGEVGRIEIYSRALKGEVMVCRNFEDLLIATSGDALSSKFDYENGVQDVLNQNKAAKQISDREFVWLPDEKGKGFEQFLDRLREMYDEAGDWNEVDRQRIQRQINRNI
jgi:hypothetical protein